MSAPLPTVAGNRGDWALCQPFIIGTDHQGGNGNSVRAVDEPLSTTTTKQRHALCQPFLIKFYGNGDGQTIDGPLATVTTKDRFGLSIPVLVVDPADYPPDVLERMPYLQFCDPDKGHERFRLYIDILFRMLKLDELAAAQGFPKGYRFKGNTSQAVKQVGNAVPKNLAKALGKAALAIL